MQQRLWVNSGVLVLILTQTILGLTPGEMVYTTLKSGTSIRATAMGGAFSAIAEENGAFGYNPAGLAVAGGSVRSDNYDFQGTRSEGYGGNYVYASPFGIGKWRYSNGSNAVDVTAYGLGRHGSRGVDFGVLYKTVETSGVSGASNGWSTDLGAIFRVTQFMDIGIVAQDVLKKNVNVPTTFRSGVALFNSDKTYYLTGDVMLDRGVAKDEAHVVCGAEYELADGIRLRGGWQKDSMTGGIAIALPIVEVDYAFSSNRSSGQTLHELGFKLGRGVAPSVERRQYALFKPSSFAEFSVASNVVEGKSEYSLLNGNKLGSNDLISLIRQASQDPSCDGFIIHIGDLSGSLWGISMIQEIRTELEKAKSKGKYIAAYIDGWASLPEYYLATVADKIVMPELGSVGYLGIKLDVLKMRYLLSNFGVNYNLIQSGKYKTALYSQSPTMDSAERVVMEDVVNDLYRQVLGDIKSARKLDWGKVGDIFDGHMISAREALDMGLIDNLGYPSDVETLVQAARNGKSVNVAGIEEFSLPHDTPSIISPFNRIAVLEIDGEITNGSVGTDYLFGNKSTGAVDVEAVIDQIQRDIGIRGVLVRINSPGGSMLGSDRILSAIEKVRAKGLPVYVSMGNMAASGGYYVAMGADRIFANRGTLTGSIGVISIHPNYSELNDLLDIRRDVIKTGKYMDALDQNAPVTPEDLQMANAFQDKFYRIFTQKLKKYRNLTDAEVDQVAQGQVILGEEAQKLKIVDELGNFYVAVDELAKKINVTQPELMFYRRDQSMLASFLERGVQSTKLLLGMK